MPGHYVVCVLQPSEETPVGSRTAEGKDLGACRDRSTGVHGPWLNVSNRQGSAEAACAVAIEFAIQQELPKNMTVLSAWLTLHSAPEWWSGSASRTAVMDRNLTVRNIQVPWDEDTARWATFPSESVNSSFGPMDTNEGFHQPTNPPQTGGGSFGIQTDASPPVGNQPVAKDFVVTRGVAAAYLATPRTYQSHTHGWYVRDENNAPCTDVDDCRQVFYSSAARTPENKPVSGCQGGPNGFGPSSDRMQQVGDTVWAKDTCWPKLSILFDPNPPQPRNLTFHYNTSRAHLAWNPDLRSNAQEAIWMPGKVAFNLSLDAYDARGRLGTASYEIKNKTGVLLVRENFQHHQFNRSFNAREKWDRDVSVYWTTRAFGLPEDRYYVNVTIFDVDGHRADVNFTGGQPVLWIDNTPPRFSGLAHPATAPQAGVVNVTVRAEDARGIDAASLEVTTPSGNVVTLRMRPWESEVGTKNGLWSAQRGFFEPGIHTFKVRANDTLGNANVTTGRFTVLDVKAPQPCGGNLTAAEPRFLGVVQEEGGAVRLEACVTDDTPVNVTARFTHPSGATREVRLARVGATDRYLGNWTADLVGRSEVCVEAVDRDGNRVEVFACRPVFVEPGAAPRSSALQPPAAGWANATPVLGATLFDYNLDRASVRLLVSVDGGPFERVTAVASTGSESRVLAGGLTFTDGSTVTARLAANDTLGRTMDAVEWSFRVDTKAPRLNATLVGERHPGPTAQYVTRDARVGFQATDAASGVARVEGRWTRIEREVEGAAPEGAATSTPWRALEGDEAAVVDPQVDRGAGLYVVELRAVDVVGNAAPAEEVRVVLDPDPPVASVGVGGAELRLDLADAGSGLRSLVVGTRLVGDPAYRVTDLEETVRNQPQGGRFLVPMEVVGKGELLEYYVTAVDNLGNRLALGSALDPVRYLGVNHRPTLELDAPENESEIQGALEVRWVAEDEDLDPVRVDVDIRPAVLADGESLASNGPARGLVVWDSRTEPDGLYVVTVTARDAESRVVRTLVYEVNNTGTGVGRLVAPPARVEYLGEVRFEVTLYRPVVDAKLRVVDEDGNVVATHPLVDDGTRGDRTPYDGVYTATYAAKEKGEYRTDVEVVYADAGTVVLKGASTYTVASSFGKVLERNLVWFLVGGAVLVMTSAFVVVQLMRYGYI